LQQLERLIGVFPALLQVAVKIAEHSTRGRYCELRGNLDYDGVLRSLVEDLATVRQQLIE